MNVMRRTLAILANAPIPGKAKADLCPPLDNVSAARLSECFTLDILEKASAVPEASFAVCYRPIGALRYFREIAPAADRYLLQHGRDLGERLNYCFEHLFDPGRAVVALLTDNPTLPARSLEMAFDALATGEVDVVFGPTDRGRYGLVGMASAHPEAFEGIDWRSESVLEQSIERAARNGLGWYLLPEWYDVNGAENLQRLKNDLLSASGTNHQACHTRRFVRELAKRGVL